MSSLRWLILIPYYFFLAMSVLSVLLVAARLLRVRSSINTLVGIAIATSFLSLFTLLGFGFLTIQDFRFMPILGLFAISLSMAAVDVLLARVLALPLDEELAAIE